MEITFNNFSFKNYIPGKSKLPFTPMPPSIKPSRVVKTFQHRILSLQNECKEFDEYIEANKVTNVTYAVPIVVKEKDIQHIHEQNQNINQNNNRNNNQNNSNQKHIDGQNSNEITDDTFTNNTNVQFNALCLPYNDGLNNETYPKNMETIQLEITDKDTTDTIRQDITVKSHFQPTNDILIKDEKSCFYFKQLKFFRPINLQRRSDLFELFLQEKSSIRNTKLNIIQDKDNTLKFRYCFQSTAK
jgi:hypothetical protein